MPVIIASKKDARGLETIQALLVNVSVAQKFLMNKVNVFKKF
ncbi:hypothetical protein [Listeria kieliensis]